MSKMIIENNMHGEIYALNEGKGANFIISVPIQVVQNA
jgi:hypothetical protein